MRLLILFLFFSMVAVAQEKDYLLYHSCINKAEDNLVMDRADSVFFYYDKAFSQYDFIFVKDAFISAQYAWKHRNREKASAYLIKGSFSGLRSSCLDQAPILKDFVNSPYYNQVFDSMKLGNGHYNASLDAGLRDEWIHRYGEQEIARNEESDFITTVQNNVARIRQLMALNIFPGVRTIGLSPYCMDMGNYFVYEALANYDCVIAELYDGLWKAVKKGELHPRDFAALWEMEQMWLKAEAHANVAGGSNRVTNRKCPGMKNVIRHFKIAETGWEFPAEEVNRDRALFYICSLETDQGKKELEKEQGYVLTFEHKYYKY